MLDKKTLIRYRLKGKICKKCSKKNPEGASHCRKCGYSKRFEKWYRRRDENPRG